MSLPASMSRTSRVYLVEPQQTLEAYRERIEFLQGRIRALELENKILRGTVETVTKKLNGGVTGEQHAPPLSHRENECTRSSCAVQPAAPCGGHGS
jgi:hypothetical protein